MTGMIGAVGRIQIAVERADMDIGKKDHREEAEADLQVEITIEGTDIEHISLFA
jgi:hypothetical protein